MSYKSITANTTEAEHKVISRAAEIKDWSLSKFVVRAAYHEAVRIINEGNVPPVADITVVAPANVLVTYDKKEE